MGTQALPLLGDREFEQICALMQQVSGIRLGQAKKPLVASRLLKRLRSLDLSAYSDYVALLARPDQDEERRTVVDLLTTNETFFFREAAHFDFLRDALARFQGRELKVWSAACSSGEEVYTLAMVLAETLGKRIDWNILGTDLCRSALKAAAVAVYPVERARNLPQPLLHRYCLQGVGEQAGRLQIGPELRARARFGCLNLIEPLPAALGRFHVIFLRNALIYFDEAGKRDIVGRLLPALEPGGLLFVGHSEGLHGLGLPIRAVSPAVYQHSAP
jgi:chemotaxis protein methyltransferase CheR